MHSCQIMIPHAHDGHMMRVPKTVISVRLEDQLSGDTHHAVPLYHTPEAWGEMTPLDVAIPFKNGYF